MTRNRIDLSSEPPTVSPSSPNSTNRRYVGIQFACCGVYARIYVNRDNTAYEGACPKCHRSVRLRIGPEGTDQRFFTAY